MEQFLENIKDLEVTTVERAQEALDKRKQRLSLSAAKLALTAVNLLALWLVW
ncbi:conserved domain protein [Streptococcus infantis SK970]|nr:conserved domain protein [Streptococcus infantis SK970]